MSSVSVRYHVGPYGRGVASQHMGMVWCSWRMINWTTEWLGHCRGFIAGMYPCSFTRLFLEIGAKARNVLCKLAVMASWVLKACLCMCKGSIKGYYVWTYV